MICERCKKNMDEGQFYTYKDGRKTELCKKCLTAHIDNFNPETFTWILEKLDFPYVPSEWNSLRDKAFAKNPKLNGMSVFGKYVSKMRLNQWKKYHWADNDKIAEELAEKQEIEDEEKAKADAELEEKYKNGEITEAEYKTLVSTKVQYDNYINNSGGMTIPDTPIGNPFEGTPYLDEDTTGFAAELTDEDKTYLAMKWGGTYRPSEWVELERIYKEMTESFDIQDADTIHTLILICKTNLKMNQAIDSCDMDGFQKLSRVYESLRKSAKFTAAQNKEEKNDFVDCVGELVTMCERDGFIPRYATDIPQDKVDLTLKDMNNYVKKLVTQDLGFGQQIEDALKKIQIQKEMNEAEEKELETGEPVELVDTDYEDFYNNIEAQKALDRIGEEEE